MTSTVRVYLLYVKVVYEYIIWYEVTAIRSDELGEILTKQTCNSLENISSVCCDSVLSATEEPFVSTYFIGQYKRIRRGKTAT